MSVTELRTCLEHSSIKSRKLHFSPEFETLKGFQFLVSSKERSLDDLWGDVKCYASILLMLEYTDTSIGKPRVCMYRIIVITDQSHFGPALMSASDRNFKLVFVYQNRKLCTFPSSSRKKTAFYSFVSPKEDLKAAFQMVQNVKFESFVKKGYIRIPRWKNHWVLFWTESLLSQRVLVGDVCEPCRQKISKLQFALYLET